MKVNNQSGQIFVLALIVLAVILVTTLVLISRSLTFFQNSQYSINTVQALHLAEAGVDKAVASLNKSGGTYNGEAETVLGGGSYSVVITNVDASTKKITATGYVPNKANPKSKKTIELQVSKGVGIAFNYGIQTGEGGLEMEQQGIVNGSIYANGNIVLGQQSEITGDAWVAGGTQPTANQETECVDPNCLDFTFGKRVPPNTQYDVAQSFMPSSTAVINKVALKLKKIGTPPNLTVRILGNSGANPNKNNVLATGTLSASLVTTQYGWIEVTFSTTPTLTADTTYWIVVDSCGTSTSACDNSPNYWHWSNDSSQGYNRGVPKWSPRWDASSPVWNNITGDLGFKVYMGGVNTSITGQGNGVEIGGNAHANTITNLRVNGGAYYQTISNVTAGSYYPGSSDPPPLPMPISQANIDEWKAQAEAVRVTTGNITTCPGTMSGKYVGNVTLPQQCTVTVESPIWVTGNFYMNQQSKLRLNSSYGASSGVFIVDNFVTISQQNSLQGSCGQDVCANNSYLLLISEFNSRDDPTERNAIYVDQQGSTGALYSNLGKIRVNQQNEFIEITAWKISLGQQMEINYDQGLAGAFFSSGPSGSYSVIKGTYQSK